MTHHVWMSYADDPEGYRKRLEAKLAPHRIRSTLAFAGLYQLTHELIKRDVVEEVRQFFGKSPLDKKTWFYGEDEYRKSVLSRHANPFKASLLWLIEMGAITEKQADRLDAIYAHRHQLTHELGKYLVDVDFEPDTDLFTDALSILGDLSRFWTRIEMGIGTFDEYGDVGVQDITPGYIAVLALCMNAYFEGLKDDPDHGGW